MQRRGTQAGGLDAWATPGLVGAYALAFAFLHTLAASWGQLSIYSLWFPVAGIRFAMLWRFGARLAWALAAAELAVHLIWGNLAKPPLEAASFAASVVLPPLAYGAAIAGVKRATSMSRGGLGRSPMPLAVAIAAAPTLASLSSLPWAYLDRRSGHVASVISSLSAIVVFLVGDLLGVLLLAPPLLWLFGRPHAPRDGWVGRLEVGKGIEAVVVVLLMAGIAWVCFRAGMGLRLEPMVLAVVWVGLRLGTAAAWAALTAVSTYVLFFLPALSSSDRISLHMLVACIAVTGYAAGSYSDANERHLREMARKDRLLYQAERLKTLRAMSVSVIHEIAQPLSTLAIEARHLSSMSREGEFDRGELELVAGLIEKKSSSLADLVRRMRSFGSRADSEAEAINLSSLVRDAIAIVGPEAKTAGVEIRILQSPDIRLRASPVELQQAIVNLLRNAVAASPGRVVLVEVQRWRRDVTIRIDNPISVPARAYPGMGVGMLIARSIIEAHGGDLGYEDVDGHVRCNVRFPVGGSRR